MKDKEGIVIRRETTYLKGTLLKKFDAELAREEEKPAQLLRTLIKEALNVREEKRISGNKNQFFR
jgi:hypothetical protein